MSEPTEWNEVGSILAELTGNLKEAERALAVSQKQLMSYEEVIHDLQTELASMSKDLHSERNLNKERESELDTLNRRLEMLEQPKTSPCLPMLPLSHQTRATFLWHTSSRQSLPSTSGSGIEPYVLSPHAGGLAAAVSNSGDSCIESTPLVRD